MRRQRSLRRLHGRSTIHLSPLHFATQVRQHSSFLLQSDAVEDDGETPQLANIATTERPHQRCAARKVLSRRLPAADEVGPHIPRIIVRPVACHRSHPR